MLIGTLMKAQSLKLKQASAVLQVRPKDLQNLVQFGVVKPKRGEGTYVFDGGTLLSAKFALYIKKYLGTPTRVLSKSIYVFSATKERFRLQSPNYVRFVYRLASP